LRTEKKNEKFRPERFFTVRILFIKKALVDRGLFSEYSAKLLN